MLRNGLPVCLTLLAVVSCKSVHSSRTQLNDEPASQTITTVAEAVAKESGWEARYVDESSPASRAKLKTGEGLNLAPGRVTDRLVSGEELLPDQAIQSPDGRFRAVFQADGNFVIYLRNRAIWAAGTNGRGGSRVTFQADGNLVMYNPGNAPLWTTGTYNQGGQRVQMNNNGSLVIYKTDGTQLWTSGTGRYPPATPTDERPISVGKWGTPMNWPVIPIHSVLLPTGKVFTFGTNTEGVQGAQFQYDLWTPGAFGTNGTHETLPNQQRVDIFCAAPILLGQNAKVLIPGGDERAPNANVGIKDTLLLNSTTQTLERGPDLAYGRWYETATTLANGDVLIHGGIDGNRVPITAPEVYSPTTNSYRTLMGAANGDIMNDAQGKWWYPRHWLAPNGQIFGMTADKMYYMDTNGAGSVRVLPNLPDTSRSYISSAVMYRPGKILQLGGSVGGNIGGRGSDGAIDVDINGANPTVTNLNPMAYERVWPSTTILPSGEVFVNGGSAYDNQLQDVVYRAEMWNPDTKAFRPLSNDVHPRLYHSSSILLPDGTVLVGGGGAPGPRTILSATVYSPPYLFDANGAYAARPAIDRSTSREDHGHVSAVSLNGAEIPTKAVLIATGAVTHSFDMNQRFIPLTMRVQDKTAFVTMPATANLAPPGYYMLFLLNAKGVPSIGKIVSLGVPRERNILRAGDVMSAGDSLVSPDGRTRLAFQADGNLVIYFQNQAIWATGTQNRGAVMATMQADGNLVLYNANKAPLWSSNTWGAQYAGGQLELQSDANLVIYKDRKAYWTSNTCCR